MALAESGLKEMGESSLAHYTKVKHARTTDGMLKGGFMLPRQYMFVCGPTVRNWICGSKPKYVCAVGGMLDVGFMVLSQIIFGAADGMLKVGFVDLAKSYCCRGPNVKRWLCGQG